MFNAAVLIFLCKWCQNDPSAVNPHNYHTDNHHLVLTSPVSCVCVCPSVNFSNVTPDLLLKLRLFWSP